VLPSRRCRRLFADAYHTGRRQSPRLRSQARICGKGGTRGVRSKRQFLCHSRSQISSSAAWSACGTSSGQAHSGWAGIIEANEQVTFPPLPVTVTQLPVTRCQICHRTVAYRPGSLSEVLTEHYRRAHPEALGIPSQQPPQAAHVSPCSRLVSITARY